MPKETRLFCISGNNKGLLCPFKPTTCQEGCCRECQLYLDWQRSEEMVMYVWRGEVLRRAPILVGK